MKIIAHSILTFLCAILIVSLTNSCSKKKDATPQLQNNPKPIAGFSFTITDNGTLPVKVGFKNEVKYADTYKWYFDDGKTSDAANPEHVFEAEKNYNVKLVVSNKFGVDSITKVVGITQNKPKADFTYTITNDGEMPAKVQFANTSINANSYKWYFGDNNTSTSESPLNTYIASKSFIVKLVANGTNRKDSITKTITINPVNYSVRVILITPTDRSFNQKYYDALKTYSLNIQKWYKDNNNGKTFTLNNPIVDTLKGIHTYNWYNQNNGDFSGTDPRFYGYYNTVYEINQLFKNNLNTTKYVYAIYVAAPGGGAGGVGFCALGDQDLDGLLGINPENTNINRWIGGSAHEWGHAFGLPHPPGQEPQALMWTGYTIYPNCILQQADKDILLKSPFFK